MIGDSIRATQIMPPINLSATDNPKVLSNVLAIVFGVVATSITILGVAAGIYQRWRVAAIGDRRAQTTLNYNNLQDVLDRSTAMIESPH